MTERLYLFPTPILKASPPDAEALNEALLDAIREHRRQHAGIDRSNIGGWHSDTDMAHWGGEPARRLADFAVAEVSKHMIDVARQGKRKFNWSIEMWANVNAPGDANQTGTRCIRRSPSGRSRGASSCSRHGCGTPSGRTRATGSASR